MSKTSIPLRHLLAIIVAFLVGGLGGYTIIANIHGVSLPVMIFGGACIALGIAIAVPADAKQALVILAPYIPDRLIGGSRHTDPPADRS